jgi:GAF domain-containing protein/HAMP domain-containing protein
MNNFFRIFDLTHWPIRRKLVIAVTLAVVAPLTMFFIVLEAGANARDLKTTESYVELTGSERAQQLSVSVRESLQTLRDLTDNLRYRRDLINMFAEGATRAERQTGVDFVNDRLIETRLFTDVRFINPEGVIIANTISNRSLTRLDGTDVSHSPAFLAGQDAVLLKEDQRNVIYTDADGSTVLDVTQVLYYSDRSLAGYIVATLNLDHIVISQLNRLSEFIPVISYVTTTDGVILSQAEDREYATASREREQIQTALAGASGILTYQIDENQYTVYIAPIEGTRFFLVTETPEEIPLTSPLDAFLEGSGLLFLIITLFTGVGLVLLLNSLITTPLNTLRGAISDMSHGNFDTPLKLVRRRDELGAVAQSFVNMREQVRQTIIELETRVAERVRDIQATQEVSRFASTQRDLQQLMDEVVNLIIGVFPNIYHAQIFLIDTDRKYAVLRASTGEAGRKLLERGHRLAIGSVSVIGQVTSEGRTVIARDTSASSVHRRNEFLLDTRAELAIPLRVGDLIIGALDVQSKQDNSFSEDQVNVLQIMADQIAISLDNARLYQESIRRLEQLAESSRQQTLSAWRQHMYMQRTKALVTQVGIRTGADMTELREEAIRRGETVIGEKTERNSIPFAVPIQLRGQVIGAVEWEVPAQDYTYEKVLLAEELVSRLAISLDNARLFEQSQRATERERVVNSIAARLTGQTDIDEILQTAIREVGQALRVPEVNIRLNVGRDKTPPANGNGRHSE